MEKEDWGERGSVEERTSQAQSIADFELPCSYTFRFR